MFRNSVMFTQSNFLNPLPMMQIKLDMAKNLLKVKPKFLALSRPRMNASNTWSEFVTPNKMEIPMSRKT